MLKKNEEVRLALGITKLKKILTQSKLPVRHKLYLYKTGRMVNMNLKTDLYSYVHLYFVHIQTANQNYSTRNRCIYTLIKQLNVTFLVKGGLCE